MYHFTFIYFKFYCLGTESIKVLIFITVFIICLYYLNILASSVNFVVLLFFLAFSGHLGMSSCAGSTGGLLWELSISFCLVSYLSPVIYPYTGNFPVIRYFDYLFKLKKKKKLNGIARLIWPDLVIDTSVLIYISALKISGLRMERFYIIFFFQKVLYILQQFKEFERMLICGNNKEK